MTRRKLTVLLSLALLVAAGSYLVAAGRRSARATTALSRFLEDAAGYDPSRARALLEAGAKPDATGADGATLLHLAAGSGDDETLRSCLQHGGVIEARDRFGNTPLHMAVTSNQVRTVELLLQSGADVNAQTGDGHTPLDLGLSLEVSPAVLRLLRARGARTSAEGRKLSPRSQAPQTQPAP